MDISKFSPTHRYWLVAQTETISAITFLDISPKAISRSHPKYGIVLKAGGTTGYSIAYH